MAHRFGDNPMDQQTFIIGNREFTCVRMNAFAANKLMMRLQKVALPVIGTLMGGGQAIGDMDVSKAARIISENIDESVMDNIVLPMFNEAKVYAVEEKKFVKGPTEINMVFTAENLFDLYELIFEVGKFQFSPFFSALMGRFGNQIGAVKK